MNTANSHKFTRINLDQRPDLRTEIIQSFKNTRYFLAVSDETIEALLKDAHLVSIPAGHKLISEGNQHLDVFYFLISGSVGVQSEGKYFYSINNAGEAVGELAVITQSPRSADVITEMDTQVVEIRWKVIQKLEDHDPQRSQSFFKMMTAFLAEKLHITTQRVHLYENFVTEVMEKERRKEEQTSEILIKYDELERSNAILKNLATRDQMTNLYNHGELMDQLRRQIKLYSRNPEPFSLVIGDLDNFKQVNDTWGHLVGDEVIRNTAKVFVDSLREEMDTVFRQGGEEFAVIMRNTPESIGGMVMNRVRSKLESSPIMAKGTELFTTMSLGVGSFDPKWDMEEFITRVDQAMYLAKQGGRNRVMPLAEVLTGEGQLRV